MEQLPRPNQSTKRFDIFTRFLQPPVPEGEENYYNKIKPLISKNNSISFLQREDIPSYLREGFTAKVFLTKGQERTSRMIMTDYLQELGLSQSIEGWFGEEILSGNKVEYTQTQNLHEYQHPTEKKGFFRR